MRLLLELGADPSAVSLEGAQGLHLAAFHGHTELVRTLLSHFNPNPNPDPGPNPVTLPL